MNEYRKRLCDLVNLEENSRSCVLLTLKEDTSPLDLVRLGGFEGHERMFRMSKDPRTTCITVFRDGDEPYHIEYGASTTLVDEDRRKVRQLVMECVNLDFGIFTHGGPEASFASLVEETIGKRDLDSPRHFMLQRTSHSCSLKVNNQHIANIDTDYLETWLVDRNTRLEVTDTEPGRVEVDLGYVHRVVPPEREHEGRLTGEQQLFNSALEKAADAFFAKTGWSGLDAPAAVQEFVRFSKQQASTLGTSLDEAIRMAKEKSEQRLSAQKDNPNKHKSPEQER